MDSDSKGEAVYYHATVYSFNENARQEVLERTKRGLSNPGVRVSYDAQDTEQFCIVCPTREGVDADEVLHNVIEQYIEQELQRAQEESRAPNIVAIPIIPNWNRNVQSHQKTENRTSSQMPMTLTTTAEPSPRVTHLLCMGTSTKSHVKLFQVYDLPVSLLDRLLCPTGDRAAKLISQGLTARLVRQTSDKKFTFNGRVGASAPPVADDDAILTPPAFPLIKDLRKGAVLKQDIIRHERGSGIEDTAVDQWLSKLSLTTQAEPNADPEIPKGAKSNINELDNASRRTRVPKGHGIFETRPGARPLFAPPPQDRSAIVLPPMVSATLATKNELEAQDSDEDSDFYSAASYIESMDPGAQENDDQRPCSEPRCFSGSMTEHGESVKPGSATRVSDLKLEDSPAQSRIRSRAPTASTDAQAETATHMPTFGHDFAIVDAVGLTANKVSAAKWQHENYSSFGKIRSKPVILRTSIASTIGVSSQDRSRNSNPYASFSQKHTEMDVCPHPSQPTQNEPTWINRYVFPDVPHSTVVDVGDFSPTMSLEQSIHSSVSANRSMSANSSPTLTSHANPQDLLRLDSQETVFTSFVPHDALSDKESDLIELSSSSDDEVIESKQQSLPSPTKLKYTMRQKAKPKGSRQREANGRKVRPNGVQLPLPDPILASKSASDRPKQKIKRSGTQNRIAVESRALTIPQNSSTHLELVVGVESLQPVEALLQEWQCDLLAGSELNQKSQNVTLLIEVGMAILRFKHRKLGGCHFTREGLETELNDPGISSLVTHFLPRLTTRASDMDHLLRALTAVGGCLAGQLKPETLYEINLCEIQTGKHWTIIVPTISKMSYAIKSSKIVSREAFLHYPGHVYDAHILQVHVEASACDASLVSTVDRFVRSMHTAFLRPSFEAHFSSEMYHIESVLAKSRYSCPALKCEMQLHITEIQELELALMDIGRHFRDTGETIGPDNQHRNIRALASTPEAMIQEQRLWWEASFEMTGFSTAQDLSEAVRVADFVLRNADDVGFNNMGPFVKSGRTKEAENTKPVAFW